MVPLRNGEIVDMYRRISESLTDPSMLAQLGEFFDEKQTLPELLDWIHSKVKFNKATTVRHNDPLKIVECGQGKCREFSVLFNAICLANGYRARLILDLSDHAWVEVWDAKLGRWIHVDPSEKRIDDPEMYERDWKKNLKEVYAFEKGRRQDVTDNYKRRKQTTES